PPHMSASVRHAGFAGSWYPGDPAAIVAELDRYLAAVPATPLQGRLVALVSPHAGLRYSGPVAAHGYRQLRGRADLVVVLVGPAHRPALAGCAVFARGAWKTPLGQVPVAEDVAAALVAADPLILDSRPRTPRSIRSRCRCPSSSTSCRVSPSCRS